MKVRSTLQALWLRITLLLVVGLAVIYATVIWVIAYDKPAGFSHASNLSSVAIATHNKGIASILSIVMDRAQDCRETVQTCEQVNYRAIYSALGEVTDIPNFPSTYFIRVSNNRIQKLFLSGKFVNERVTTLGEVRTLLFLTRGAQEHLICPDMGVRFLNATCLADFPSPAGAEDIIRFKYNDQTIGAVVKLYGT